ncbi:MAG: MFS transporter [Promethearchaeota archaeon]
METITQDKIINNSTKSYFFYLVAILSLFQIYRSYIIDGARTTALVWYFFPDVEFELGLSYLSYIGIIAGLGGFLAIFIQSRADYIGRKPILIIISLTMALMTLVQLITENLVIYTISAFFIAIAGNVFVWMIYISEESPKGKNAVWSTFILMIGIIGPLLFNLLRFFFITNDKDYTIANWKNILYLPILMGFIITFIIIFTFKETSAYKFKQESNSLKQNDKKDSSHSMKMGIVIIFKSSKRKAFIMLMVITVLFTIGFGAGNVIEPYIMIYSAIGSEEYSIIVMISLVGSAFILFFITGRIADRFGRKPVFLIYTILYPISILLQYTWAVHIPSFTERFIIVIALKIIAMGARGGIWTLATLISFELVPTKVRGLGNGLQTFIMFAFGILRTLIVAPLFPLLGIQLIAIISSFFMFPIIPLLIHFIPETKELDLKNISL